MGIYVAAILVSALATLMIGGGLLKASPKELRPLLITLVAMHLPMCAVAYYGVRMPLDSLLRTALHRESVGWAIALWYAPFTEEPAKWWSLLLIPAFRIRLKGFDTLRIALAVGLGFGIGEAWLVAHWITQNPEYAGLPWYVFGGYAGERFQVCLLHGLFTASALRFFPDRWGRGFLLAAALHWIGNAPVLLPKINPFGLGDGIWKTVVALWLPAYLLILTAFVSRLYGASFDQVREAVLGRTKCPECGFDYARPIFLGLNFGSKRYERCPICRKWHWN